MPQRHFTCFNHWRCHQRFPIARGCCAQKKWLGRTSVSDLFSPRFQFRNEKAEAWCTYTGKSLKNLKFSHIVFTPSSNCKFVWDSSLGSSGSSGVGRPELASPLLFWLQISFFLVLFIEVEGDYAPASFRSPKLLWSWFTSLCLEIHPPLWPFPYSA